MRDAGGDFKLMIFNLLVVYHLSVFGIILEQGEMEGLRWSPSMFLGKSTKDKFSALFSVFANRFISFSFSSVVFWSQACDVLICVSCVRAF